MRYEWVEIRPYMFSTRYATGWESEVDTLLILMRHQNGDFGVAEDSPGDAAEHQFA